MNDTQESSTAAASTSVQLDGFAPAAGLASAPVVVMASSAAAGGGGGGAGMQSIAIATTSTVAATASSSAIATTQTKRAKKRGPQQPQQGQGGSAAASTSTAAAVGRSAENNHEVEESVVRPLSEVGSNFVPITLPQIQLRLKNLLEQLPKDLPKVPPSSFNNENNNDNDNNESYNAIKSFASTLQITIEEYNLLLSLVSSATYTWGVDRSGASQQNLAVMSAELQQCQDVISNVVSARLSNVLCPAVDILIGEVEVVRAEGGGDEKKQNDVSGSVPAAKRIKLNDDRLSLINSNIHNNSNKLHTNHERRINHYTRPLVDPSYVHLCHCILARNAPLIRHAVATSIHTAYRVIGDYMKAMKKDTSHDAGKGGYY